MNCRLVTIVHGFLLIFLQLTQIQISHGGNEVYFVDNDGDGYGRGVRSRANYYAVGPLDAGDQPDANDNDPSINTPQSILNDPRYGSFTNIQNFHKFYRDLGYSHQIGNVYFISPNGDDTTGQPNDITKPFATARELVRRYQYQPGTVGPGDIIVWRQGIYSENLGGQSSVGFHSSFFGPTELSGIPGRPITLMAYPGEIVLMNGNDGAMALGNSDDLIVRGFTVTCIDSTNNRCLSPGFGFKGIWIQGAERVTVTDVEVYRMQWGIWGGVWAPNVRDNLTISNSVIRDNSGEHGIYFSTDFNGVTKNVYIYGNRIYRNRRTGIQHNGLALGFNIVNNIIHSNALGGISFNNGISGSYISNNLIFNNQRGIVLFTDNASVPSVRDGNHNNVIINNTIWVGRRTNGMCMSQWAPPCNLSNPTGLPAIDFADWHGSYTHTGNIIANNILVAGSAPVIRTDRLDHIWASRLIHNNLVFRLDGQSEDGLYSAQPDSKSTYQSTLLIGPTLYYYWSMNSLQYTTPFSSKFILNRIGDPKFRSAEVNFNFYPQNFDFEIQSSSPAKDGGIFYQLTPSRDFKGRLRNVAPDMGALETWGP